MEFLKLIGTFLIQPLLWLGILWTGVCYALRIRSDRRNFKIALNKDCFEIRHFIKKGILWGVSGSLISLIIGCYLPLKAIVLYEILAAVAVLCISRIDLSAVPLYILGILAVLRQPAILPVVLLLLGFNYLVKGRLTHGGNAVWFTAADQAESAETALGGLSLERVYGFAINDLYSRDFNGKAIPFFAVDPFWRSSFQFVYSAVFCRQCRPDSRRTN